MCVRFERWMMLFCLASVALAWPASMTSAADKVQEQVTEPQAELSSLIVSDGSVLLVKVRVPEDSKTSFNEEDLTGKFGDLSFPFFRTHEGFQAVLGIRYAAKPGSVEVRVVIRARDGREAKELKLPFMIIDGNYASEQLRVSPKHLNPSPKDLVRIRKEQKEIGAIYRSLTRTKHWDGPFKFPIDSPVTSVYGTKRVFNGELASFHSGTDLRAPVGTPIHAPAPGVVVLAKDLFFSGGTVMIDHGYGVITFYAHMSKFRVKKGEKVKTGHLLGLSGATGRVSGPHLHWSAVVHGTKVNPMELMKLLN